VNDLVLVIWDLKFALGINKSTAARSIINDKYLKGLIIWISI
jgi:hypothetical protein